jgi:phage tail-like protein|tara:strand:+ start:416 stop:949 length:534 start_codon:yes stop_codon:yes gene_type:complete
LNKKDYPALGFKFKVTSTLSPEGKSISGSKMNSVDKKNMLSGSEESYFQSISGIKATAGDSIIVNAGINNRQYKLPTATTYPDLILTRGLIKGASQLGKWCQNFLINDIYSYYVERRIINVMLLDKDKDDILMTWSFYDCYPKEMEIGAFNADKSEIAIETLTLAYSHFSQDISLKF